MNTHLKEKVAKALIVGGICFTLIFAVLFVFNSTGLRIGPLETSIFGHFGDLIGGFVGTVVALIGVLLLWQTLSLQKESFDRQQIETRFFELLKLHRDNVAEMKSKGETGRAVFVDIKDEFHKLYDYTEQWYDMKKSGKSEIEWRKDVSQISYLVLFFGIGNSSTEELKKRITTFISDETANIIFSVGFEILSAEQKKRKERNKDKPRHLRDYLDFDGHQSRLGHYYRHLFQTAQYINDQIILTYQEKYNYLRMLRAQLSNHEQALFLYNSISPLGLAWELDPSITDENKKLITKYNLICNLPLGFTEKIDPKTYYPDVFFEHESKKTQRRLHLEEEVYTK
jgi:hypothetical protein